MNGQFQVAQASGTGNSNNASPPRIFVLTKPLTDQAVVINVGYDQKVKVDFSHIANEKITLVHVGEKLIILFDNQSTVTVEPFFDSRHDSLQNLTIEVAPGRDLSVSEFASSFPINDDPSVLPAAGTGNGNAQATGGHFDNPAVDPLPPIPTNILAPPEVLPNLEFTNPTAAVLPTNPPPPPPPVNPVTIVAGIGQPLAVDESFIPGIGSLTQVLGTKDSNVDTENFASSFTVNAPAGVQSVSYALSITGGNGVDTGLIDTATGNHLFLFLEGGQIVAREGATAAQAASGPIDARLAVDAAGNVTFTDLRAEHEFVLSPDVLEGISPHSGLVSLTATVTDNNNNTATASIDLGPLITIHDDVPHIAAVNAGPAVTLSETNLTATALDDNIAGSAPDATLTHTTGDFSTAFAHVNGADGATIAYSLGITGGNGAASGLIDSHTGLSDVLVLNGNTIEGHVGSVGGTLAFTIALDPATGIVTFMEDRPVSQAIASSPDTGEGISLTAGIVNLTATITDGDGDQATASIDLGKQLTITDDGPSIQVRVLGEEQQFPTLAVDESFIPGVGSGVGSAVGGPTSNVSTADFSVGVGGAFTVTPGADGIASTAYSLTLHNGGTSESTTLIDAKTGGAVTLFQTSGTEIDAKDAAGDTVFTLTVNGAGQVTLTDLRGLVEGTGESPDQSEFLTLASNLVSVTATVTDNDKDTASASIDLGGHVQIYDDGPLLTAETTVTQTLAVDESFIPGVGSGVGSAVGGPTSNVSTADFSVGVGGAFTVTPGADGIASTAYSLTLHNGGTSELTTLIDAKTGGAVTLFQTSGTEIDAKDAAGDTVFTLTVNGAGQVTLTDLRGLVEGTGESPDQSEFLTLASNLVSVTATVTDNDKDTASASIDLGGHVQIYDDGPLLTAETTVTQTLAVDESFIPGVGSGVGSAVGGPTSNVSTADFSVGVGGAFTVTPGADGIASTAYSLTLHNGGTSESTTLIDAKTGGAVTLFQTSGTEIDAKDAAGDTVFTLTVNGAGQVTLTDLRGLVEGTGESPDQSEFLTLASNLVSVTATVTDNDKDTASASIDLGGHVQIYDDGPLLTAETTVTQTLAVDESFIPGVGSGVGSAVGGPTSNVSTADFSVGVGGAFTVTPGADGIASTAYSLTLHNGGTSELTTLIDAKTGGAVTLFQTSGTEIDAKDAAGDTVFTLTVNGAGQVTLTDLRGLVEGTGESPDQSEFLTLASNLVSVTATVTDNDKDTASASIDLGGHVQIYDDGPLLTAETTVTQTLAVDESFIPGVGSGVGSAVGGPTSNVSTADFSVGVGGAFTVTPGADGIASTAYSLTLHNGGTSESTTLIDAKTGGAVTLFQTSGTEIDAKDAAGDTVFTLTVNGAGQVTLTDLRGLVEGTGESPDQSEFLTLASNLVSVTATVTDNDKDTASASIDLGGHVQIYDDGPLLTAETTVTQTLAVDESFIPGVGSGVGSAVGGPTSNVSTADFSVGVGGAFTVTPGADGIASTAYSLTLHNGGTSESTTLIDAKTGGAVTLFQTSGTEIDAKDAAGDTVFTLTVNGAGQVTLTDLRGLVEGTGESPDQSEFLTLASNLVSVTATVTDNDKDTASASIDLGGHVQIYDDGPLLTAETTVTQTLAVDESFIPGVGSGVGSAVGGPTSNVSTADFSVGVGGAFTVTPGADGIASTAYSLTLHNGGTSESTTLIDAKTGGAVTLFQTSGTEIDAKDAAGDTVFTLTVNGAGQVTLTDLRGLVEGTGESPDQSEFLTLASNLVSVTATVTDNDKDTASASIDLGGHVQIYDDGPLLTAETTVTQTLAVDESFIPGVGSGVGSAVGGPTSNVSTADFSVGVGGAFTVTPGADGIASTAYSLTLHNGGTSESTTLIDAKTGGAVTLFQTSGTEIDAKDAAGDTVFTLTVNGAGQVTLTDLRGLVEGTGESPDQSEFLTLASNLVSVTATVTDNDKDTASASIDLGGHVQIYDDGPLLTAETTVTQTLAVDESFIPGVGSGVGSAVGGPTSNVSTADFSVGVGGAFTVTPGADGIASTAYSLTLHNGGTSESTTLIDAKTGGAVTLFQTSGTEIDAKDAAGDTVFTLTVNGAGQVTLTDLRGLVEGTGESPDQSEFLTLASNLVSVTATVTDNDKDTASASIDLGGHVQIYDDGPLLTAETTVTQTLAVDESFIPGVGSGVGSAVGGPTSNVSTADFSVGVGGAFTVTPGADGIASTAYSLTLHNGGTSESTTLIDAKTGGAVTLFQTSGTEIDAKDAAGDTVFTLTVNGAGQVTLTDLRGLVEGTGESPDQSEFLTLASNLVSVTATVTDNDKDTASASIDLGGHVQIYDDGPLLTAETTVTQTLAVDESFIPGVGSGVGSAVGGPTSNVSTADFSVGVGGAFTVTPGADGIASTAYSLTLHNGGTSESTTLIDAKTGGAVTLFQTSGTEIDAKDAAGDTVFTLTVNGAGQVTLTDLRGLVEGTGESPDQSEFLTLASNLVSVTATVTDNDKDTASASIDLGGHVQIYDDGPVIGAIDNGIVADAANTSITGNIAIVSGADGFGTHAASLVGDTPPAGLTFDGQAVSYFVDPNNPATLIAYIGADHTIAANDIFTLSVDANTDHYTFDLLQPFTAIVTQDVGSSSAFGSGPAPERVLLTDGSGTPVAFTNEAAVVSGIDSDGITNGAVNGSTNGWGVNNQNFDVGEKMLFDFTNGGSATPGGVSTFHPIPNEEVASYTFSNYKSGDKIDYTVSYWDGTHVGSIVSTSGNFDPSTHASIATEWSTSTVSVPAGDVLYTVSFTDVTGSGKVDLQSVGVFTTQNLSQNLSFGVNTTDGDGDTASGTIHVNIDGSTTLQGTAANDVIGGSSANETIIGGAGADTLTGGGGSDTFKYLATSDSTIAAHDVITDFNNADVIDFSAISGITNNATFSATAPTTVAAHSVVYFQSGADTHIVANASSAPENVTSADMLLVLTGIQANTVSATAIHHA